ncbi:MAG: ATP-binding protein [Pseudomonadota bacterium]
MSGIVQALVVGLLIWNTLRLMDSAINTNAMRVAREYAVTLNLSMSRYASSGRLGELSSYLSEMLTDPDDSFARYIVVLDQDEKPLLSIGQVPGDVAARFKRPGAQHAKGLQTFQEGESLHARAPLLLKDYATGALYFGLSTADLRVAKRDVLLQGTAISVGSFVCGLILFYLFTVGIGRRLRALTMQSQGIARGDYATLLPEGGGDELEIFSRSLNKLCKALGERIAALDTAERQLAESEERFKVLFDTAPVPLTVTDQVGKLMLTNLALNRVFGLDPEDILGKTTAEIGFWESADERARIWDIFHSHGVVSGEIARARLHNGRTGYMAVWSSSLSLGGEAAIIWALLDLTAEYDAKLALEDLNASLEVRVQQRSADLEKAVGELSTALETLKRTQNDLISAEKMASLGSLVAGVAHELNTPIGNSLLAATTLNEEAQSFEQMAVSGALKRAELLAFLTDSRSATKIIAGSLEKAAHLIASFKQVAADQTTDRRRTFNLATVVRDTLAAHAPRLRKAACATTLAIPEAMDLESYPGSLSQVINNLISNALMHAFDHTEAPMLTLSARAIDAKEIELVFADNGAGMSADVKHRVFDPFFTTKMGQGGTGLGMNITYNIVTGVLGGRVSVDSAPGQGARIVMQIPFLAPLRESGDDGGGGTRNQHGPNSV